MKILKQLFAVMILMAVTFSAWAGPNVKDVEAAMRAKNWQGAETMLNQVLQSKPNSAKALYLLAQTHEQMGLKGQALQELNQARANDPSLKFASRGAVDKMTARLERQTNSYAATPSPRQSNHVPQAVQQIPTVGEASHPVIGGEQKSGGIGGILVVAFLLITVSGGIYYFIVSRQKKAEMQRLDDVRRSCLAKAVELLTQANDLQKTARYEGKEKSSLGVSIGELIVNATSTLVNLKSGLTGFNEQTMPTKMVHLENQVRLIAYKVTKGEWEPEALAPTPPKQAPAAKARPARQQASVDQAAYDAKQAQIQREFEASQNRERVAELTRRNRELERDRNHGPDILTTVLVANVISNSGNHHYHDGDRGSLSDNGWSNNNQPAYEVPEPEAPELDFGGSRDWDNEESKKSSGSSYSAPEPEPYRSSDSGSSSSDSSSGSDSSSSSDGF